MLPWSDTSMRNASDATSIRSEILRVPCTSALVATRKSISMASSRRRDLSMAAWVSTGPGATRSESGDRGEVVL